MLLNISRMSSLLSPTFSLHFPLNPLCFPPLFSLREHSNFLLTLRPSSFSSSFYMSSPPPLNSFRGYSSSEQKPPSSSPSGEIHVIIGPMFAGKTTTLLRRIQSETKNGRSAALIKSSKDTRYDHNSIVTHDGDKYPCLALHNLSSFKQEIGRSTYDKEELWLGAGYNSFSGFCNKAHCSM